jgi:hypothetical protein
VNKYWQIMDLINKNKKKKRRRRKKQVGEEVVLLRENEITSDDGSEDGEEGDEESEEDLRRKMPLGHRSDVDLDGGSSAASALGPWPKFLLVTGEGLGAVSLLKSSRWLSQHVAGVTNVTRQASGSLGVAVSSREASDAVLGLRQLCGCPVEVSPHWSFNSRRGVFWSRDLLGETEDDLLTELASVGVVKAKRITRKSDGADEPTPSVILTFDRMELPSSVRVGFLSVRVRPYVPNPLICYRCFRYGHTKARCRGKAICAKCGGADHTDDRQCEKASHCRSCGGDHSALSRDCPVWLQEREVQRVVAADNVPFSEAVRRVPDPPSSGRSFAEVATSRAKPRRVTPLKSDSGTQTVDQRSVGVQVGASGLEVSSVETETEAPSFAVSRVQTKQSLYEFYSATAGEWVTRVSEYDFDETTLHGTRTPYDDDDPFVAPHGLGTIVGGKVFADSTVLASDVDDTDDEEVEEMEEVQPSPQRTELRYIVARSRSINRPAPSHTGRASHRRESRSPIKPP